MAPHIGSTIQDAYSVKQVPPVFGILQTNVVGDAQSVPDGTNTNMVFANVEIARRLDLEGPVGARTGIEAPIDGIYQLAANLFLPSAVDETLRLIMRVNGIGTVGNTSASVGGNEVAHVGASILTPLDAGDIVSLQGFVSDSGGGPHDVLPALSIKLTDYNG